MTIDFRTATIHLSKKEYASATRYSSPEYEALTAAMSDHPNYGIVIKEIHRPHTTHATLTYEDMKRVILAFDETRMQEFEFMRSTRSNYGAIKKWFLANFADCLS